LRAAVTELELLCLQMELIGVDGPLAREAGKLAERHRLRGYDAVHLASALVIGGSGPIVATWDRALAAAASACGCTTVPAQQLSRG
jgi:predicted nucleic acid-binding protein